MYCKACGKELHPDAEICMGCGVPAGKGSAFCPNCGEGVDPNAIFCVHCGATLTEPIPEIPEGAKSRVAAGILGVFLGAFGVHNFYLKRTGRAVIQLLLSVMMVVHYVALMADFILSLIVMEMMNENPMLSGAIVTITVFCFMISAIWGFVEGLLLLLGSTKVDGRGTPFRD